MMRTICDDIVDLHTVYFRQEDASASLDTSCLDSNEIERMERFLRDQDRRDFAFAHIETRRILAEYSALAPRDLEFFVGSHGKPSVNLDGLHFNISHTRDALVVAVSGGEIGVDIETSDRGTDFESVAGRYFGAQEWPPPVQDPSDRRLHFFDLWALKEAYIKARGLGLAISLKSFAFHGAYPDFTPILDEEGAKLGDWTFWNVRETHYHLAVAAPRAVTILRQPVVRHPIS